MDSRFLHFICFHPINYKSARYSKITNMKNQPKAMFRIIPIIVCISFLLSGCVIPKTSSNGNATFAFVDLLGLTLPKKLSKIKDAPEEIKPKAPNMYQLKPMIAEKKTPKKRLRVIEINSNSQKTTSSSSCYSSRSSVCKKVKSARKTNNPKRLVKIQSTYMVYNVNASHAYQLIINGKEIRINTL